MVPSIVVLIQRIPKGGLRQGVVGDAPVVILEAVALSGVMILPDAIKRVGRAVNDEYLPGADERELNRWEGWRQPEGEPLAVKEAGEGKSHNGNREP